MSALQYAVWERIFPEPNTGCWLWGGALNRGGYGTFGRHHLAHRYVYEMLRAPISEGLQIDHKCRVRCCVNPDHMEPVTGEENTRRSPLIGRWKRERCRQGHAFTPENTRWKEKRGYKYRACRVCERAQNAKQWKRLSAQKGKQ